MSYPISIEEDTFLRDLALSTDDVIEKVVSAGLACPQAEASIVHRFGPGIYIREMHTKAGAFAIGKMHKHPHMNIVLSGSCVYYTVKGERKEVVAPATIVTPAGRKIAIFLISPAPGSIKIALLPILLAISFLLSFKIFLSVRVG